MITRALGTDCSACHHTDSRDYAADTLLRKVTAREMMELELALRDGLDWRAPPANLCVSCHQGQFKPPPESGSD